MLAVVAVFGPQSCEVQTAILTHSCLERRVGVPKQYLLLTSSTLRRVCQAASAVTAPSVHLKWRRKTEVAAGRSPYVARSVLYRHL
jgi:hypothetical protein